MNRPRIYRKWYPKLKRHFWNVSPMPPASKRKILDYWRWQKAFEFTCQLNNGISIQVQVTK